MPWDCLQLGSREHYIVPAALHAAGKLDSLSTDVWVSAAAAAVLRPFLPAFSARRSDAIPDRVVRHATARRLVTDAMIRAKGLSGWDAVLTRNAWFGNWAAGKIRQSSADSIFSYSYTARVPFLAASARGMRCILGQVDPGPLHVEAVRIGSAKYSSLCSSDYHPPQEYWNMWRQEIDLAKWIVVNSSWSKKLLIQAGVSASKIVVIPVAYAGSRLAAEQQSEPIVSKKSKRASRLQVLYLGTVSLGKGAGQLFDALLKLKSETFDMQIAGPLEVTVPSEIKSMPNVRFLGAVDPAMAEALYRESDVFLFPTLSDGFGLTQLEALAHGLPVIASPYCARLVENGKNGLLLDEVTADAIADAIMMLVRNRDLLSLIAEGAGVPAACRMGSLAHALIDLETREVTRSPEDL